MQRREFITNSGIGLAGGLLFNDAMATTLFEQKEYKTDPKPKSAKYIWVDKTGEGRNVYVNFRKAFTLNSSPTEAYFNLFADTSYQLFVNGQFVNQGPIRFDPRYPVYDAKDLVPYLKIGENVIAVQVNYFGMKTYKSIPSKGGFVGWGTVKTENSSYSLDTNSQNWKVKLANERSQFVNKLSFALNPADLFNQALEDKGWKSDGFDAKAWKPAVELTTQTAWGVLIVRKIPYFKYKPLEDIIEVKSILPLAYEEDIYSFSVPVPDFFNETNDDGGYIAFKTYIYSEIDQQVPVKTFWAEAWLNGEEIDGGIYSENKNLRKIRLFNLKKGWNFYMGKMGLYFDVVSLYLAFPKDLKIKVSADKNLNSDIVFYRTPLLKSKVFDKTLSLKALPYDEKDDLKEIGGWLNMGDKDKSQSPVFASSWDSYDEAFEKIDYNSLSNKVFKKAEYPFGFCILLDLSYTHLLYPTIKFSGVKGAIIDFCNSEQLTSDNEHLFHMHHYQNGDRILCSEDVIEWLPPHPRGTRYISLTVRNLQTDVKFERIELQSANYPVTKKGNFISSDPLLNQIWEMCLRTQTTTMEDAYVDCVGRERGMYIRDTVIQYYNNLAVFGDHALMRRCFELYGQSNDATGKFRAVYPNSGSYTISDFCLNAVEGFRAYYNNTGDKEMIAEYWTPIVKNLGWFDKLADERPNDLLLDAEWHTRMGITAHYGGFHGDLGIKRGYLSIKGVHCIFSITYLIALQDAVFLAKEIGKEKDAHAMQKRIDVLTKSINTGFWDEEKGCYADNLDRTSYSAHASLFAVRAGIVSKSQLERIKKYVSFELRSLFVNGFSPDAGTYVSPSFCFYIFDGLYKAGLQDVAEKLMKDGWGWALSQNYKTAPEYFEKHTQNSMCHAWSASPMYYLSCKVLGIRFPKAPDLNYVEILVQTNTLSFAEGQYPHPNGGTIDVKWHLKDGKRVFDYVKAPDGVVVSIVG